MKRTVLGTIIILLGIILLGNSFNLWNITLFFKGWWTLFIIIPSLIGLFEKNNFLNSFLSLLIGILLLLASRHIIAWSMVGKMFLPVFIIIIGLMIIFGNTKKIRKVRANSKEYLAIFSGVEEKITEIKSDFSIISIFGSVELDLSDAKIKEDTVIHCVSIFGGIDLKLPLNVKVESSGVPIFGGLENKVKEKNGNVSILVDYVAVFGGIDLL